MSTNAVSLWVCNGIALAMFLGRLCLRQIKRQAFTAGDYWTMSATVFLVARVVVSHYILLHGTTTVLSAKDRANLARIGDDRIAWLILNSKLNLVSRFVLNSMLWSLKMVVLDLCRRMIRDLPHERIVLHVYWATLGLTYIAATIAIFVECRPFPVYWQLSPNPGDCVQGNAWLLTYEIGNIITDAMLLALPFPLLFRARTSLSKRIRLVGLFSFGFFLIAISIVRMIQGNKNARIQLSRTMWASIETTFAAFVAMVPTFYILIRAKPVQSAYELSQEGRKASNQWYHATISSARSRPRREKAEDSLELTCPSITSRSWSHLPNAETGDAEPKVISKALITSQAE